MQCLVRVLCVGLGVLTSANECKLITGRLYLCAVWPTPLGWVAREVAREEGLAGRTVGSWLLLVALTCSLAAGWEEQAAEEPLA